MFLHYLIIMSIIENMGHVWFNFISHNSFLDIDTAGLTNEQTKDDPTVWYQKLAVIISNH